MDLARTEYAKLNLKNKELEESRSQVIAARGKVAQARKAVTIVKGPAPKKPVAKTK